MIKNLKSRLIATGVFDDNAYLDEYVKLIESNTTTEKQTFKTQSHHIIPGCYFKMFNLDLDNSRENRVNLYHKDHVLAHYYICLSANNETFRYYNELTLRKCLHFKYFKSQPDYISQKELLEALDKYQELMEESNRIRGARLRGTKRPPELLEQISKSLKKVEHTLEWNTKVSEALKGRKNSEEAKQKMSKAHLGRKHIHKDNVRKSVKPEELEEYLNNGWILGDLPTGRVPWNKGLTGLSYGKGRTWTEEQRARRSGKGNPMYGRTVSRESIEKGIETKRNNGALIPTEETKNRISNSLKGYKTVFKGDIEKHIRPEQLEEYLALGYKLGQKSKKKYK